MDSTIIAAIISASALLATHFWPQKQKSIRRAKNISSKEREDPNYKTQSGNVWQRSFQQFLNEPFEISSEEISAIFIFFATVAAFVLGAILFMPVIELLKSLIATEIAVPAGAILATITGSIIAYSFWCNITSEKVRIWLVFIALVTATTWLYFLVRNILFHFTDTTTANIAAICISALILYYIWEWIRQKGI